MKIDILRNGKFPLSAFVDKKINDMETIYSITFEDKYDVKQYGTIKLHKEFKGGVENWTLGNFNNNELMSLKSELIEAIMRSENDEIALSE